eukprot:1479764-Pleurochrysis_carterae.AAC.1
MTADNCPDRALISQQSLLKAFSNLCYFVFRAFRCARTRCKCSTSVLRTGITCAPLSTLPVYRLHISWRITHSLATRLRNHSYHGLDFLSDVLLAARCFACPQSKFPRRGVHTVSTFLLKEDSTEEICASIAALLK